MNRTISSNLNDILFFTATFLIPYFLMLALCGIPMMMSEFSLGQYLSLAPPTLFATICRMGRGEKGNPGRLNKYDIPIYDITKAAQI